MGIRTGRGALKRTILAVHKLGIRLGIHILPVHYYSPVPNILELRRTRDAWSRKSELPGIPANLDEQVTNLRVICKPYLSEYVGNEYYEEAVSNRSGPGYGYVEAQALHGVVRHFKPQHIVEIGSGVSTYCLLKASDMNAKETGHSSRIVSVEPSPSRKLRTMRGIDLITQPVQTVPLEVFTNLTENDLLFIDSSHTVKPGGDVNYLILEVLPRLRKGVIVHFHDIFLPYDYQRDVCRTFFHWAETSLLRAFLIFNERVEILMCLSHLHYDRRDVLREVFPEYNPQADVSGMSSEKYEPFESIPEHFPSSTYLKVRQ
jgi:predicted O-methyltransferase YrrM